MVVLIKCKNKLKEAKDRLETCNQKVKRYKNQKEAENKDSQK